MKTVWFLAEEQTVLPNGIITSWIRFDLDDRGRKKQETRLLEGERTESVRTWDYNAFGPVSWILTDPSGKIQGRGETFYSSEGFPVRETTMDGRGILESSVEYTNDDQGRRIRSEIRDARGILKSWSSYVWEGTIPLVTEIHDASDRVAARILRTSENGMVTSESTFDSNGTITSITRFLFDSEGRASGQNETDGQGSLRKTVTIRRDKEGNPVESEARDRKGRLMETTRYRYISRQIPDRTDVRKDDTQ